MDFISPTAAVGNTEHPYMPWTQSQAVMEPSSGSTTFVDDGSMPDLNNSGTFTVNAPVTTPWNAWHPSPSSQPGIDSIPNGSFHDGHAIPGWNPPFTRAQELPQHPAIEHGYTRPEVRVQPALSLDEAASPCNSEPYIPNTNAPPNLGRISIERNFRDLVHSPTSYPTFPATPVQRSSALQNLSARPQDGHISGMGRWNQYYVLGPLSFAPTNVSYDVDLCHHPPGHCCRTRGGRCCSSFAEGKF